MLVYFYDNLRKTIGKNAKVFSLPSTCFLHNARKYEKYMYEWLTEKAG